MSDAGYSTERHKYHDSINLPFMVSLVLTLLHAKNTMKNTIDDADYIINMIAIILIFQYVINSSHSHSIVAGGFPEIS